MPIQAPSWTEFLSCPICCNEFAANQRLPISLGCGHTICRQCLATLHNRQCPFDQTSITTDVDNLPINNALLQLVNISSNSSSGGCGGVVGTHNNNNNNDAGSGSDSESAAVGHTPSSVRNLSPDDLKCYKISKKCIENLALHLKSLVTNGNYSNFLSRPMQRKLVTLINCQLMEEEGRVRALRAARSLGERTVTELILQHQNSQQLSSNLWAAVRSRGCQFLGPAMQEEVLKLVLMALEDGKAYSRKVLVMFVVQRLEPRFPQASKTSIGHVVQLLYRASCFKVSKREADSSLMQLKEEFRSYETLRREHDAQIVQIATEAGLRIAPDQWSSLLYGDASHKSHMQSIIDKLQTPSSFSQSVQELMIALQRTGDPANLSGLRADLKHLASIDPSLESAPPTWQELAKALDAVRHVVVGLVEFVQHHGNRKMPECVTGQGVSNPKYKISLCRDLTVRKICPRGSSCTFAHSEEELERYRAKNRKNTKSGGSGSAVGGGQNSVNTKKDYSSHHSHHSPHNTMLRPGEEVSAPASTATSPMRFGGGMHGKMSRGGYGDTTSPLHHGPQPPGSHPHLRPLHHSPIPPSNGQPMAMSHAHPRFEAPNYGSTSYNTAQPPNLPHIGVNTSSIGMRNSGAGIPSPRNYQGPMPAQPLQPPASLTTANPPKYQNNNPALGNALSNKNMYNMRYPDLYNTNMLRINSRSPPFFTSTNNGNSSTPIGNFQGTLWDHQHRQPMGNASAMDILGPPNQHTIYTANDTSFFGKKPSNLMDLSKAMNGYNIGDSYNMFKNAFNNNNVNNNNFAHNASALPKDNFFSGGPSAMQGASGNSPFWNTHNIAPSNGAALRNADTNSMQYSGVGGGPQNKNFPERSFSFVRSDSILDDDNTTFDVPVTSAAVGSKFGPICPIYKGMNSTNTSSAAANMNLDSWNSARLNTQSGKSDHPLLEHGAPGGDLSFSVFSGGNENNVGLQQLCAQLHNKSNMQQQQQQQHQQQQQALQQQQQQQQQQKRQQQQHGSSTVDNIATMLSELQFTHMPRSLVPSDDNYNLSTLYNMRNSDVDDNANIDLKKNSVVGDNHLWNSIDTNSFFSEPLMAPVGSGKEQQKQQQQPHQSKVPGMLTGINQSNEENGIESGMSDIEQNMSELVDKVLSPDNDSGIKMN